MLNTHLSEKKLFIYEKHKKPHSNLYNADKTINMQRIHSALTSLPELLGNIHGKRIALTAGSRQIADAACILRLAGEILRTAGANPFILAAMGSHGGGSPEGQLDVLMELGITEESTGMQIVAWDSWTDYGTTETPLNDAAAQADGIILFNRIKPHTSFHGEVESGLSKMLVVGLGGPAGAKAVHSLPLPKISKEIARRAELLAEELPLIGAIAVIEDENDMLLQMKIGLGHEILTIDKELLDIARDNMPAIPIAKADILMVREIGKCFSGTGMDTNVISRLRIHGAEEPTERFARIIALRLADAAGGNGYGIGLADFTTEAFEQAIDRHPMYLNALTSGFTLRAMLPMVCATDEDTLFAAAKSLGKHVAQTSIVIIRNTLDLSRIAVTFDIAFTEDSPPEINGYDFIEKVPFSFIDGQLAKDIP